MRSKYVKTKRPTVTYPLLDVMAYAVMATDINNGEYFAVAAEKFPSYDEKTNTYPDAVVTNYSNKEIMHTALNTATGKPHRLGVEQRRSGLAAFKGFVPNAKQKKLAVEIVSYYQGLMFKAIGGKINEFEQKVLNVVNRGEINDFEFGITACLPKSYARSIKRDRVELEQRVLSDDSQHVGKLTNRIELDIEILRVNHIKRLDCYVVNAKDTNNNLIVFFTGKGNEFNNAEKSMKISARVKRHQVSNHHGGKETVLNYVKKIAG